MACGAERAEPVDKDPPIIVSNPSFAGGAQVVDDTHEIWGRRCQLPFNYDL